MRFVLIVSLAIAAAAVSAAAQAPVQFGVASIKPTDPDERGSSLYGAQPSGFSARGVTLATLAESAYQLMPFQLRGGSDWVRRSRYTVAAKYPDGWSLDKGGYVEAREMLRGLLADRFRLRIHREAITGTVYTLKAVRRDGRVGSGLQATTDACGPGSTRDERAAGTARPFPCMTLTTPCSLEMNGRDIGSLASLLSRIVGAPIRDETGMSGSWDVKLKWADSSVANACASTADSAAFMFTALQEQLGLRLDASRGSIEVTVIDNAEPPTPD
jgi:uncharacterized protein (TIGR03435 family)